MRSGTDASVASYPALCAVTREQGSACAHLQNSRDTSRSRVSCWGLPVLQASTVQILGAEKALFRALKTKHETPKYGLIYHASLIGQASPKNKARCLCRVSSGF